MQTVKDMLGKSFSKWKMDKHITRNFFLSDSPLSDGLLINLSDAISKSPDWKDIPPYLGLEDRAILETVNDDQIMPSLRIFKMLQHWQRDIMQNDETCRVTLIGVLQKFRVTRGLQILGQTVEGDEHIPDPSECILN